MSGQGPPARLTTWGTDSALSAADGAGMGGAARVVLDPEDHLPIPPHPTPAPTALAPGGPFLHPLQRAAPWPGPQPRVWVREYGGRGGKARPPQPHPTSAWQARGTPVGRPLSLSPASTPGSRVQGYAHLPPPHGGQPRKSWNRHGARAALPPPACPGRWHPSLSSGGPRPHCHREGRPQRRTRRGRGGLRGPGLECLPPCLPRGCPPSGALLAGGPGPAESTARRELGGDPQPSWHPTPLPGRGDLPGLEPGLEPALRQPRAPGDYANATPSLNPNEAGRWGHSGGIGSPSRPGNRRHGGLRPPPLPVPAHAGPPAPPPPSTGWAGHLPLAGGSGREATGSGGGPPPGSAPCWANSPASRLEGGD